MTNSTHTVEETDNRVTPEMQAAWMEYDPAVPLEAGMPLPRVSGLLRHAFFCGFKAASHSTPAGEDVERVGLEALAAKLIPGAVIFAEETEHVADLRRRAVDILRPILTGPSLPPSTHDELVEALEPNAETWASINQWCDDTFGPATIPQIIGRAKEEFEELEAPDADHAIEAADVVICLCRIPGFAEALLRKMKINRARKWRLTGNGTGYHIPEARP